MASYAALRPHFCEGMNGPSPTGAAWAILFTPMLTGLREATENNISRKDSFIALLYHIRASKRLVASNQGVGTTTSYKALRAHSERLSGRLHHA